MRVGKFEMMSLEDRLPGTYRLVAMETRTTAGHVSWPMGERPTGIFMFDGSNSCAQIAPTDHGEGDSGVVAMFGTYEVDVRLGLRADTGGRS